MKNKAIPNLRVGVQLEPQHTTYASYAEAVREVEALGVGASHIIITLRDPWNFAAIQQLVRWRDARR